jgi:uncharacterized protein (TIGR02270 family)
MGFATSDILAQHVEEASFLWSQRAAAVVAPHHSLHDLARLEERVAAHIDGLRVNGSAALELITSAAAGEPGAMFAAALLSVEAGEHDRFSELVAGAAADTRLARGLVSSLGWLSYEQIALVVEELFASEQPSQKRIGIAAMAIHREHPGPAVVRSAGMAEPVLQARALRALGEFGDAQATAAFGRVRSDAELDVRYWAAWSAALTARDPKPVAVLQAIAKLRGPFSVDAAALAARRLDPEEAESWWGELSDSSALARVAIAAAGARGDPVAIPWLIERMAGPLLARRAGEAFSLITGMHIAYDKLERKKPEDFQSGPTDDPADEDVEMDPDDNLAWPDPALVARWWAKNGGRFSAGTRYLLGKPISVKSANEALRTGYQRQRAAAAIELAILQPGEPLFEVRAPAARQRKLLGL